MKKTIINKELITIYTPVRVIENDIIPYYDENRNQIIFHSLHEVNEFLKLQLEPLRGYQIEMGVSAIVLQHEDNVILDECNNIHDNEEAVEVIKQIISIVAYDNLETLSDILTKLQ